jgi:hypothetical protein
MLFGLLNLIDFLFWFSVTQINSIHFGNGNIKWGLVKKVIASTLFFVFNIQSLNRFKRLRQKHFNSSTNLYPFLSKGVIYVIQSVNNSRMLYVS